MSNNLLVPANIAQAEALRVILAHEKINYSSGLGAGNVFVFEFEDSDIERVKKVIEQWRDAVKALAFEIGGLL